MPSTPDEQQADERQADEQAVLRASMQAAMDQQGAAIRHLRHQRGWTEEDLAARLDLGAAEVRDIERGRRMCSLGQLRQVAEVFGVAFADLVRGRA